MQQRLQPEVQGFAWNQHIPEPPMPQREPMPMVYCDPNDPLGIDAVTVTNCFSYTFGGPTWTHDGPHGLTQHNQ